MLIARIRRRLRVAAARVRRRRRRDAVVLLYHSIADVPSDPWALHVTPRHFTEHLDVLTAFDVLPLHDLPAAAQRLSGRAIAITFDDGYANNLSAAVELEQRGMPATLFVSSGALDLTHEFWWDELERLLLAPGPLPPVLRVVTNSEVREWPVGCLPDPPAPWRSWERPPGPRQALYVSVCDTLRGMSAAERDDAMVMLHGWAGRERRLRATHRLLRRAELADIGRVRTMAIGAHGMTHASLAPLPEPAQRYEIAESRRALERVVERPVTAFAYPFGQRSDYGAVTVRLVREAGYTHACAAVAGRVRATTDPLQIPRFHVTDCDGAQFAERLEAWLSGPAAPNATQ